MGFSTSIYICDFIKVKLGTYDVPDGVHLCSNPECRQGKQGKFCSVCGSPITLQEVTKQIKHSIHSFTEHHFQDPDMFCDAVGFGSDIRTVFPNWCKGLKEISACASDGYSVEAPHNSHSEKEWLMLFEVLDKLKIPYVKFHGVVVKYD